MAEISKAEITIGEGNVDRPINEDTSHHALLAYLGHRNLEDDQDNPSDDKSLYNRTKKLSPAAEPDCEHLRDNIGSYGYQGRQ